jgi:TonB-dependent SusC/RagA subfamily outer membrane receptor
MIAAPSRTSLTVAMLTLFATTSSLSRAQSVTVSGTVVSDLGQPLGGANLRVTELGISVATNAEGRYRIVLTADSTLAPTIAVHARAIGFKPATRRIAMTGDAVVNFTLTTDINRLEEVVIAGVTSATPQRNLPFTVSKVSAADMPVPAADPLSQLAGKVPGAQVTSFSGRPGSQPAVLLRGPKSLNALGRGQDPLYIVDGVSINGALPDLNPQDIESIEVVKGAAAATLYGSRAGNGVVQITTFRGRTGSEGTAFRIRSEFGRSDIPGEFPLSTRHFLTMDETGRRFCVRVTGLPDCSRTVDLNEEALRINEQAPGPQSLAPHLFVNDFAVNGSPVPKAIARGTFQVSRWPTQFRPMSAIKTDGAYASHNVDVSGRSANLSYFASASSFVQDAPFESLEGFRRQSMRLNLDNQVRERFRLGVTSVFSRNQSGAAHTDDGPGFRNLARVPAGIDLTQRDRFGRLLVRSNPLSYGSAFSNPLYEFEAERQTNEGNRFIGDLNARYVSEWLTVEGNVGFDNLGTGFRFLRDQNYRVPLATAPPPQGIIQYYRESQQGTNRSLSATAARSLWSVLDARWNLRYVDEQQRIVTSDQRGTNLVVTDLTNSQVAKDSLRLASSDQTISAVGILSGLNLVYRDRYIADFLFRRDGSSLFGANNRWANYVRASAAWRVTQEPWWQFAAVSELKLRASVGTAGGRPRFDAQYETYSVASGGLLSPNTLGNRDLRPELTTEAEYGIDGELFNRIGINLTHARATTRHQLLLVPPSVASGFQNQWQNAGTLATRTWEASLNLPIMTRAGFSWSARLNYDRNRSRIAALDAPPYSTCPGGVRGCAPGSQAMFFISTGEQIGTIWGTRFITSCRELPADYASRCGAGREWQRNDEGFIVWIGEGNTPAEGITRNLWQAERPGCVHPSTGAPINANGSVPCRDAGGLIDTPNGVTNVWGNVMVLRDSTGGALYSPLGSTLPDYRLSLSQTITYRRLSFYGLLDGSLGNDLFNQGRHFAAGEFQIREQDQAGKTVQTAKPIGHYWRGGAPESAVGNYGFYNILGPNSWSVEDASFVKLREVSLAWNHGAVAGIGDWTVSLTGRNLFTITQYTGFDPEVGRSGGHLSSGVINGIDSWQYPNSRTLTLSIASRF